MFSESEGEEIKIYIKELLKEYETFADFTTDGISISEKYKKDFKGLFVNESESKIYNDIQNKNSYITPLEYIDIVQTNYPHGIEGRIDIDSIKLVKLKNIDNENFSVTAVCKKYTGGLTNKNKIYREDIVAHFEISFTYIDYELDNFFITKIINKKTITEENSNKKMKGFYIGLGGSAVESQLYMGGGNEGYKRRTSFKPAAKIGINFNYFFNSNFGIGSGIYYSSYNSDSESLFNNGDSLSLYRTDSDNDNYYLFVESETSETFKTRGIEIPLMITYRKNYADKISFFTSVGINTFISQTSQFYVTGSSIHHAYYTDYNLFVDDAEGYQFGERSYNNYFDTDFNSIIFMFSFISGISIPIQKKSFIDIGFEFNKNINSLNYKNISYRDDFISLNQKTNITSLHALGLYFSYKFKL